MCGQNTSLEDFSWPDIVDAEAQTHLQQVAHTQEAHAHELIHLKKQVEFTSDC